MKPRLKPPVVLADPNPASTSRIALFAFLMSRHVGPFASDPHPTELAARPSSRAMDILIVLLDPLLFPRSENAARVGAHDGLGVILGMGPDLRLVLESTAALATRPNAIVQAIRPPLNVPPLIEDFNFGWIFLVLFLLS